MTIGVPPGSFVLLLGAILAAPGCRSAPESQRNAHPPNGEVWLTDQQVRDAKLAVQPAASHVVSNEVVTSGKIAFDDLRVAHVFSPVTGRVTRILADPGRRVEKGAPLAIIQSPDVGNAFADLGKARADLVTAQHDLRRQQELYEGHAASQKELEGARDSYGKARAEMDRARQKARLFRAGTAKAVTQEFTLRAPIEGEVIARSVTPGAEVQGQYSGATAVELFTIGELNSVWMVADVFEMDLARVKKGAPVTVTVVAYPARTFSGNVDWISDLLDPVSRTARVRASIENPAHLLKPEMYATAGIGVAGRTALVIPATAVLRLSDQTVVFVEDGRTSDGHWRFIRRVVALEESEGTAYMPVAHGLAPGERVVTSGGLLLSGML
jgi:cobalt-zinc-cadmium efflux system membrane fusion protein